MFTSKAYTLQNNTTIDGQLTSSGKVSVKAQYLCSTQVRTSWFWYQHPQHQVITVMTRTILHP